MKRLFALIMICAITSFVIASVPTQSQRLEQRTQTELLTVINPEFSAVISYELSPTDFLYINYTADAENQTSKTFSNRNTLMFLRNNSYCDLNKFILVSTTSNIQNQQLNYIKIKHCSIITCLCECIINDKKDLLIYPITTLFSKYSKSYQSKTINCSYPLKKPIKV